MTEHPVAIDASALPERTGSGYPAPYAMQMGHRARRALGDVFGLTQFGINLTRLAPGARSALRHAHSHEDEFIYILDGAPVLLTDAGETPLQPGMCAGFPAGTGNAHALVNRGDTDVVYVEVGSRQAEDAVDYPDNDMIGRTIDGRRTYTHADGTPFT